MKIYNSLTGEKELFVPQNDNEVKMYACGITCSADAHIGHAKQALQFDIMRRYLSYKGYYVTYVRNHTDVDDKIIANAQKAGMEPMEFSKLYINRINEDLENLGIKKADFEPKASETIPEIISFIERLVKGGYAYKSSENDDIYFDVQKFDEYGKLSNRDVESQLIGVRKDVMEGKKDDRDFALWKSAKDGEIYWDSPWGKGRPGWHIECSAMCEKFLGETIDIHGGGRDLKFPHHENEIAQSECRFHKPMAKYWVHCGLVKVNGVKMSKSLNNGISIRQALAKYNAEVIKLVILQTSYRSDLNIISGDFLQAEKHMYDFYKVLIDLVKIDNKNDYKTEELSVFAKGIKSSFEEAMDDDLNTAKAIADLFGIFSQIRNLVNKDLVALKGVYQIISQTYGDVLSLFNYQPLEYIENIKVKYLKILNVDTDFADSLMQQRNAFKQEKNYVKADECKQKLIDLGLLIVDTKLCSFYDIDWSAVEKLSEINF